MDKSSQFRVSEQRRKTIQILSRFSRLIIKDNKNYNIKKGKFKKSKRVTITLIGIGVEI